MSPLLLVVAVCVAIMLLGAWLDDRAHQRQMRADHDEFIADVRAVQPVDDWDWPSRDVEPGDRRAA